MTIYKVEYKHNNLFGLLNLLANRGIIGLIKKGYKELCIMRPTDYLQMVKNRLDASIEHIDDFKVKSEKFFNTHPYAIISEEEPKGETKVLRYRFIVHREIPRGLRIPIRGCLFELRAILDNLVWGLSRIVGESQPCGINFPVCTAESTPTSIERTYEIWVNNPCWPSELAKCEDTSPLTPRCIPHIFLYQIMTKTDSIG